MYFNQNQSVFCNKSLDAFRNTYDYLRRNIPNTDGWHLDGVGNWKVCTFLTVGVRDPLRFSLKLNTVNDVHSLTIERLAETDVVVTLHYSKDEADFETLNNLLELCLSSYF